MKKTAIAVLAMFCVFMMANCGRAKPTRAEHTSRLKVKLYEVDRKVHKADKTLNKKTKLSKTQKAKAAADKKTLAAAKADLEELQSRMDMIGSVTEQAWDGFTAGLEQGMDRLSVNIDKLLGTYRENQQDETEPQ
jgi:hypothetical protein